MNLLETLTQIKMGHTKGHSLTVILDDMIAEVERREAAAAQMREAVQFYAEPGTYGATARRALSSSANGWLSPSEAQKLSEEVERLNEGIKDVPKDAQDIAFSVLALSSQLADIHRKADDARRVAQIEGHHCSLRSFIDSICDKSKDERARISLCHKSYKTFELNQIESLKSKLAAAEKRAEEAEQKVAQSIPYNIGYTCVDALDKAGMGKIQDNGYSRHGNTLAGMVLEACERLAQSEADKLRLGHDLMDAQTSLEVATADLADKLAKSEATCNALRERLKYRMPIEPDEEDAWDEWFNRQCSDNPFSKDAWFAALNWVKLCKRQFVDWISPEAAKAKDEEIASLKADLASAYSVSSQEIMDSLAGTAHSAQQMNIRLLDRVAKTESQIASLKADLEAQRKAV